MRARWPPASSPAATSNHSVSWPPGLLITSRFGPHFAVCARTPYIKQPQRRSTVGTTERADRTQRRRRSRRASSLRARRLLVVLAGHSPSGLIAARYAPAHRYRVAGLVLMDPTLSTVIADTTASIPESATRRAAELRAQSLTVYGGENPEKLTSRTGRRNPSATVRRLAPSRACPATVPARHPVGRAEERGLDRRSPPILHGAQPPHGDREGDVSGDRTRSKLRGYGNSRPRGPRLSLGRTATSQIGCLDKVDELCPGLSSGGMAVDSVQLYSDSIFGSDRRIM